MRRSSSEIIKNLEMRVARLETRVARAKSIGNVSGKNLAEMLPQFLHGFNCRTNDSEVKKAMTKFLKSEYGTTLRSVSFSEAKQEVRSTAQGNDVHITGKMHIKRKSKSIDSFDVHLVFLCDWNSVWIREYNVGGYEKWQKLP